MTDKLREAAQNILNGIETRAIRIETKQDETWANALSQLRAALAEAQQGEGDGPALKCQYPMITTVDRSKDGNCTVKAVKHPDGTFEVIKVEFQGNPCPTCHGTGVVTNHGWSDDPTGEAKPVRPCPTCHGEKP
jgi:hypothetical protein